MGSTFKKTIISKSVRNSLHGWQRRVKARQGEHPFTLLNTSSPTSSDSTGNSIERMYAVTSNRMKGCSSRYEDTSVSCQHASVERDQNHEHSSEEKLQVPLYPSPQSNTFDDNYNDEIEDA